MGGINMWSDDEDLKNGNVYRCLDCGRIFIENDATCCSSCNSTEISNEVDESDDDYLDFLHEQELQDMD